MSGATRRKSKKDNNDIKAHPSVAKAQKARETGAKPPFFTVKRMAIWLNLGMFLTVLYLVGMLVYSRYIKKAHICSKEANAYFSSNYYEARSIFRQQSRAVGAQLHTLPIIPGDDLTMDIAVVEGDNESLLIHLSGVHGVEGFAGSSIQSAFMGEGFTKGAKPTVVMVHAVNPYGFHNLRRVNENNVDLNRNFLTKEDFEAAARESVIPASWPSDEFEEMINPIQPVEWGDFFYLKAAYYIYRYGLNELKKAIVTGQHVNPKGMFFKGTRLEKSIEVLQGFLLKELEVEKFKKAVIIDVHTGLGPFGVDSLIIDPAVEELFSDVMRNDAESLDHLDVNEEMGEGAATTGAYVDTKGQVAVGLSHLFSHEAEVLPIVQEFGTYSSVFIFKALRAENAAYHHLSADDRMLEAQEEVMDLKNAFYPARCEWKNEILSRGLKVFVTASDYLSGNGLRFSEDNES